MLKPLIAEVRENAQRYSANVEELKWLIYYVGDEPAALLADWDWRWPDAGADLQPVVSTRYRASAWRQSAPAQLTTKIDQLYRLLFDQPPSMEQWATQWSANGNHFCIFIFGKLDELRDQVADLAVEIEGLSQ